MINNKINENTVILSIDSTTISASVALSKGHSLLGEFTINHPKTHSQKLMPIVMDLFGELGLKMSDVDVIAVSNGPGSFTGIRIGLATAKGLALPWNLPVAQVSSLMGLAFNYYGYNGVVCPMIDARRDEIYTSLFKFKNGGIVEILDQRAVHPVEMAKQIAQIKDNGENLIILGDCAEKYRSIFEDEMPGQVELGIPSGMVQRASNLASALLFGNIELRDLRDIDAEYIRPSEAEETKMKKVKKT